MSYRMAEALLSALLERELDADRVTREGRDRATRQCDDRRRRGATATVVSTEEKTMDGGGTIMMRVVRLDEPTMWGCRFDPATGESCGDQETTHVHLASTDRCPCCGDPEVVVFACGENGIPECADPLVHLRGSADLSVAMLSLGYLLDGEEGMSGDDWDRVN